MSKPLAALITILVLVAGFVALPAADVKGFHPESCTEPVSGQPWKKRCTDEKSGLWQAVEGRLAWLGLT